MKFYFLLIVDVFSMITWRYIILVSTQWHCGYESARVAHFFSLIYLQHGKRGFSCIVYDNCHFTYETDLEYVKKQKVYFCTLGIMLCILEIMSKDTDI